MAWLFRLQWRTSKSYFAWAVFDALFSGLQPLVVTYAGAQFLATLGAIALNPGSVETSLVYWWLGVTMGLELLRQIQSQVGRLIEVKFEDKMEIATSEAFANKLYELSQEQFDDPVFNTKVGRAQGALSMISQLAWRVPQNISQLVRFVGSFAAIFWIEPVLAIVFVLAVIPEVWVNTVTNRWRESARRESEHDRRIAHRSGWLLFDPRNMAEIRLVNALKKVLSSWRSHREKVDTHLFRAHRRAIPTELLVATIIPAVEFAAIVYIVGRLISGDLGFDQAIFLRGLIEAMSFSAGLLVNSTRFLHQASIDFQNFDEVNQTPPAIADGRTVAKPPLAIDLDRVSFRYPAGHQLVLKDVSFGIEPGEKLALVGANGSGKTTIVNLLLRQYLPTKGKIRVNGRPITDFKLADYYSCISNLSQQFLLFEHLTIRDNLSISLPGQASDRKIYRAIDLVGLGQFIKSLPVGLDTRLTPSFDGGIELSAGQRQRLCVARTLLSDGSLLVLDEPTSAIDAQAEQLIFDNIYQKYANRSVLIISHRFSTVRQADTILVIDQGSDCRAGQPPGVGVPPRPVPEDVRYPGGRLSLVFEATLGVHRFGVPCFGSLLVL